MREHLNANAFANLLCMLAGSSPEPHLVVEGEYDEKALKRHLVGDLKVVAGQGGRQNILNAAHLVQRRGFKRVRFLVDRDYDPFDPNAKELPPNVIMSRSHDLFTDLIRANPSSIDSLVEILGIGRGGGDSWGDKARAVGRNAFRIAGMLGAVRIVAVREELALNFTAVNLAGKLGGAGSIAEIVEFLLMANRRPDLDAAELAAEAEEVFSDHLDSLDYIVGDHDLLDAIAGQLRGLGIKIGKQELQRMYTYGVDCSSVKGSSWFMGLRAWCRELGVEGFDCARVEVLAA